MPTFTMLKPPAKGTAITRDNGRLVVPDDPILPLCIVAIGIGLFFYARAMRSRGVLA